MKVSLNWLNGYLSKKISAAEAEEILTNVGLEVEDVEVFERVKGGLKGVVTGEVKEKEKHPDADRLSVTKVDVGTGELLQIVCGAPNVAAGQKVLVATVGTLLYPGGEKLEIKKSKIRGVESQGMICAEDELSIGTSHEGIMVLPENTPIGMAAAEYLGMETDTVLELNITPNRSDATSHIGVARDVVAFQRMKDATAQLIMPEVVLPEQETQVALEIVVENTEACPRYSGIVLDAVKVGPSPAWLQDKLMAVGLRPINNVVDITNYVQFELGHPLHAFDLAKVNGAKVIVKTGLQDQPFVTLDGVERKLAGNDLMICNTDAPMCIAGVFGGLDSGVTETTRQVFIESAYFNPVYIRRTSKGHGLHTDASFRFERGTNPDITLLAAKRAAQMLVDICGAKVASALLDEGPGVPERKKVVIQYATVKALTGIEIPATQIKDILQGLGFDIEQETADGMTLVVPGYKVDVTREVDVVEEIIRIYGFNEITIHETLTAVFKGGNAVSLPRKRKKDVAHLMTGNGFYEILTNSLLHSRYQEKVNGSLREDAVKVLNPISSELDILRNEFVYSGLEVVAHNLNHKVPGIKIFEFGKLYQYHSGETDTYRNHYHETEMLGVWACGEEEKESWHRKKENAGFYSIKGVVESVMTLLKVPHKTPEATEHTYFKNGFAVWGYKKTTQPLVIFGEVHTNLLKAADIKQPVFYAEFNWDLITDQLPKGHAVFQPLPKYPSVRRDLALVLDKSVPYSALKEISFKTEKSLLQEVNIFDVYEGKGVPEGKKSYALSFVFMDKNRTLTDADIDGSMNRLMDTFKLSFNAEIRS